MCAVEIVRSVWLEPDTAQRVEVQLNKYQPFIQDE